MYPHVLQRKDLLGFSVVKKKDLFTSPVEVKIPVEVRSSALVALIFWSRFPPKSILKNCFQIRTKTVFN